MVAVRLRSHVEILAGPIGPRHLGKPGTMEAAVAYIEHQWTNLGDTVTRHTYQVNHYTVANLVIERAASRSPWEILVVGAHYDTVDTTPGADDNASAVAMLIETARLLRHHTPQRTLRFVAFPCEEPTYFYSDSMGSEQ